MPLQSITDTMLLGDRAYYAIREAILRLELRPGEALLETQLAAELNTSKTPIRQALSRLEQTGLVVSTPYKGYTVSELTLRDAWEILQLRSVLEGLAAQEACDILTDVDLLSLTQLLDQQQTYLDQGELESCAESGHSFHRILMDKAGNSRLTLMINILNDQFHRIRLLSSQIPGRLPRSLAEHQGILDVLLAKDGALAAQRMRDHLIAVYDDVALGGHLEGVMDLRIAPPANVRDIAANSEGFEPK